MSRIQQILEKAEREGVLHRTGPMDRARANLSDGLPLEAFEAASDAERLGPNEPSSAGSGRSVPDSANRMLITSDLDQYLIATERADGIAAEQYRALRTRILRVSDDRPIRTVLVTSPGRREGRSLTVANLGLAMAQDLQRRICVLDADFRAPEQHRLFGISETPGLSDVLLGQASLEDALVKIEDYHITVLPAGPPPANPAELLGTTEMCRVLGTLRSRFDAVIVDAPSATPLADIGVLMPLVDSVLLIVRAGVTLKPAIHDAVGTVDSAKFIGFVLNDAA
jgi:capsular exopolysaccharide synthesis family protein